jgi:hypothetical protein
LCRGVIEKLGVALALGGKEATDAAEHERLVQHALPHIERVPGHGLVGLADELEINSLGVQTWAAKRVG